MALMQEWLTASGELDLEMVREWALWLTEVERRLGTRFASAKPSGARGSDVGSCCDGCGTLRPWFALTARRATTPSCPDSPIVRYVVRRMGDDSK